MTALESKMKMLDLFSGIGGFSYAGERAGFETVGFSEIDPFCSEVLFKHWPDVINYGDIKNINHHTHVDLITGGFPCQPFSVAGKKKGRNDDRYLWPEFLRVVQETNPTWIVAENVPGIIDMELDNIFNELEGEDYEVRAFCIPACAVGAPHKRERLWIVANRLGERCNDWVNSGEKRYLHANEKQYAEAIQPEWEKFKPESWTTFNAQNWLSDVSNADSIESDQRAENIEPCAKRQERQINSSETWIDSTRNAWAENQPPIPGVDDGLPNIVDRNKSLGNSIVPQVVFPILKFINLMGV